MEAIYYKVPEELPYKLYVFLDQNHTPFLEIISPYFEYNIKDSNFLI
jgi:hypothetical protein